MGWKEPVVKGCHAVWRNKFFPLALVFTGIGAVSVTTFWVLYWNLRAQTLHWKSIREVRVDHTQVGQWCLESYPETGHLCDRLVEQSVVTQLRADFHFDLFSYYTSLQFASVSVAFWASIFAAACLAYLVKHGWKHANEWIVTAFIAFSISLAFYQGYPLLAKHEENLKDNHLLFLEHQNLMQEIRSFCVTGTSHKEKMTLSAFVEHVDAELRDKNRIPLEFDASQIDVTSAAFLEAQGVGASATQDGD